MSPKPPLALPLLLCLLFSLACAGGKVSRVPAKPRAEVAQLMALEAFPEGLPPLLSLWEEPSEGERAVGPKTVEHVSTKGWALPAAGHAYAGAPFAKLRMGYAEARLDAPDAWRPWESAPPVTADPIQPEARLLAYVVEFRGEEACETVYAHLLDRYGRPRGYGKGRNWDGWDRVLTFADWSSSAAQYCKLHVTHFMGLQWGSYAQYTGAKPEYVKPGIDIEFYFALTVAWSAAVQQVLRGASREEVRAFLEAQPDLDAEHRAIAWEDLERLYRELAEAKEAREAAAAAAEAEGR